MASASAGIGAEPGSKNVSGLTAVVSGVSRLQGQLQSFSLPAILLVITSCITR